MTLHSFDFTKYRLWTSLFRRGTIVNGQNSVKIFYEWISHCHVWWWESVLVYIYRLKSSIKLVDFNCHIWLPHCKSNHIPVSSRYFPYYIILHLLPHIPNHSKLLFSGTSIWVNHNISLTWIVRPFGDDSPKINHGSRLRENSEVAVRSL